MNETLIISLILPATILVSKYVSYLVFSIFGKSLVLFRENDYKEDIIIAFILAIISIIFSTVISYLPNQSSDLAIFVISLIALIPLMFSFLLSPLKYFFNSINYSYSEEISDKVKKNSGEDVKVYIMNKNILNAYATGVLPFTKIILLGKPIFDKLTNHEIDAMIAHEIGHIKKKHLLKLFFVNLFWVYFVIVAYNFFVLPYAKLTNFTGLILATYYGLFLGGATMVISGWFQKKFELEADSFATSLTNKEAVSSMLNRLNEESKGLMTKWSLNYPTLSERIENVHKS